MRKSLLLALFALLFTSLNAQDTIKSHIDKNRDGLLVFASHKKVYLDGKKMSKDDLLALYEQNNAEESIELIKTGYAKKNTSAVLACIGVPCIAISIPLYLSYYNHNGGGSANAVASYILDLTGTALCITAIGINAAGNARIKNSFKAYNKIVREKRNEVTLSFNVVNNGVGVRLNF